MNPDITKYFDFFLLERGSKYLETPKDAFRYFGRLLAYWIVDPCSHHQNNLYMELSSEFDVYPTVFLFLGIIQLIRINGLVVILLSLIVAVRSGVESATQQAELKSSSWSLSKKKKPVHMVRFFWAGTLLWLTCGLWQYKYWDWTYESVQWQYLGKVISPLRGYSLVSSMPSK